MAQGPRSLALPDLDPRITWSVRLLDADEGTVLAEHAPTTQLETASIGKVFLLIEVARRLEEGSLAPDEAVAVPEEHRVRDSGLLYRMRTQVLGVYDLALLVGAVSDNLATNTLLARCGLDEVRAVAPSLGYADTSLHDFIRDERTPEMPWTPSYGTAAELADLMMRLGRGEVISPAVSEQVLTWLAADTDTSMAADAFLLDPLAHEDPEYQGMILRHKTGSTSVARIDIGHLVGPAGSVAYAIGANWKNSEDDLRAAAIEQMREIGEAMRGVVTGRAREDGSPWL